MPYCKFCGMESKDPSKCEWCGRELSQTVRIAPTSTSRPVVPTDYTWGETLLDFFIYWCALIITGSSLVSWHYSSPYLLATVGGLFIIGFLLARYGAIPAFEEGWDEIGVPLMLMLIIFFPTLLVFLGFIAYALITRRTERTVIWLLSPQFVALLVLVVVTAVTGPDTVPMGMYREFRGIEFLSLSAVLLGWSAGSWPGLLGR